jgi:acyl-CoA synthetase (AMP-forming)/AMP-acid ligase II
LKVGGHRINPQEIQETLLDSGLLVEAVVLGIPDNILGHKVIALAVPNSKESPDKLWAFCSKRLPKYKMPAMIKLTKTLPKDAAGNIDQARCLEMLKAKGGLPIVTIITYKIKALNESPGPFGFFRVAPLQRSAMAPLGGH